MSNTLLEAALDEAYKVGIVDADTAALDAIAERFKTRPSERQLCQDLMHLVSEAITDVANGRIGMARCEAVSARAMMSPRGETGKAVIQ